MGDPTPARSTADIESIIGEVEPPESSVTLCLKGTLVARYEALDTRLRDLIKASTGVAGSLAGPDPAATDLADQMQALRGQMLEHERVFTFRAMPPRAFSNLRAQLPVKKDDESDEDHADAYHEWLCRFAAACCVDPVMTAEQADRLSQRLSNAQWRDLSNAAWGVNAETQAVPFSAAVSVLSLHSAGRSRPPEPSDNPDHGSLAGSPSPAPTTSTDQTGTATSG